MNHARTAVVNGCAVLLLVLCALVARPAAAGTQDGALLVLHAKAHTVKSSTVCTTWKPTVACRQYTAEWDVQIPCDVYLVVVRANESPGIAALSCGLYYNAAEGSGVDVLGYTLCADFETPSAGRNGMWPASESSNRIGWNPETNCQRTVIAPDGVHAVACAFYLYAYSADAFYIDPNRNAQPGPELTVTDCAGSVTSMPWHCQGQGPGILGFGQWGCNPCAGFCGPICPATERETWSRLKARY